MLEDPPTRDDRFTLALLGDLVEVLDRHGYTPPVGRVLVDLCLGVHHALHARPYDALPPNAS